MSSLATWADGSPRSLDNYFTLSPRPEAEIVPTPVLAKRLYASARHYAAKQAGLASIPSRDSIEHTKKHKVKPAGKGFRTI